MQVPSSPDANLLFGVLAFQNGFITRDQLVVGMQAWVENKQRPLDEHLLTAGVISPEICGILRPLIAAHLKLHGEDPRQSLAAASSVDAIKQSLGRIHDSDLQRSLQQLGAPTPSFNNEATLSLGTPSAAGARFRILRPHARGGLGEVFVARDTELGREVALKEIQIEKSHSEDARARFTREAEITGALEHPGIVPVYGLGAYPDGRPFYAMRFIRGKSLQEAIKAYHGVGQTQVSGSGTQEKIELRRLLQRFIDVCEAIDYAHSRGVLHRDLKPGNIMLGRYGETLVVDWGLAKPLGELPAATGSRAPTAALAHEPVALPEAPLLPSPHGSYEMTELGSTLGTLAYMSPEQAEGRIDLLSPASDVFSLGATLYHLLVGRPPYAGKQLCDVQKLAVNCDFVAPRIANRAVPKVLDAICRKAMSPLPADRYASASLLAQDLEAWLADEPVTALSENLMERASRWLRKNRSYAHAGGAALVLVTLISVAAAIVIQGEKVQKQRAYEAQAKAQAEALIAAEERAAAQSLAALTRTFEMGLNAEKWDDAHIAVMDAVVEDLAKLSAAETPMLRQRLNQRWAERIAERVHAPRIEEQEFAVISARLEALADRDAARARQLQQELAARSASWQTQFTLEAPFANVHEVFAADAVQIVGRGLAPPANDAAGPNRPLLTTVAATSASLLSVEFGEGWQRASELGVTMQESPQVGYEFVLTLKRSRSPGEPPSAKPSQSFADAHAAGGELLLEIRRNGVPLQGRFVPTNELGEGPLRLRGQRVGDELRLQINDSPELRSFDAFALRFTKAVVGVVCPAGVSITRLSSAEQLAARQPSALETADQLFEDGKVAEAEELYATEAVKGADSPFYDEARYKQGLCWLREQRTEEASRLLGAVMRSDGQRWPLLAGCQLWKSMIERNDEDGAKQTFDYLQSRFDPQQVAMMVPDAMRAAIIRPAWSTEITPDARLRHGAGRGPRVEAAMKVFTLLYPEHGAYNFQLAVIGRAYELDGDPASQQKALSFYHKQWQRFPEKNGIELYFRMLRAMGRAEEALTVLNRELEVNRFLTKGAKFYLLFERAKTHEHLGQSTLALEDIKAALDHIDAIGASTIPGKESAVRASVFALKGFVLESLGDNAGAQQAWVEGFEAVRPHFRLQAEDHILTRVVLLGPLSQQMTEDDAKILIHEVARIVDIGIAEKVLEVYLDDAEMLAAVRRMGEGEANKQLARRLATDTHFLHERAKIPAIMFGMSYARVNVLGGELDERQAESALKVLEALFIEGAEEHRIGLTEGAALAAAWKGFGGVNFFAGGLTKLSPEVRAGLMYIFAHQLERTGRGRDKAAQALRMAQEYPDVSPELRTLIDEALERMKE